MSNWAHKVLNDSGSLVFLTSKQNDGYKAYYYLLLSQSNKRKFFEDIKELADINLEDYGQIVATGWGEPSAEVKQAIKEKYKLA